MERMGHSTINVTLGTYGHMFPAIDEQLDEALASRYLRPKSARSRGGPSTIEAAEQSRGVPTSHRRALFSK